MISKFSICLALPPELKVLVIADMSSIKGGFVGSLIFLWPLIISVLSCMNLLSTTTKDRENKVLFTTHHLRLFRFPGMKLKLRIFCFHELVPYIIVIVLFFCE